jgi:hypothetical protein
LIWIAVSSSAALPLPLSLMPAPSWTLSRCAPAMTTLSGLPLRVSARTFHVVRVSAVKSTSTRTVAPGVFARFTPTENCEKTAGMVRPVASPIMPTRPVSRPGWPSFMTTTPAAPAAWAFSTLTLKPQVPRWTSAMLPAAMPVKSAGSQPLVDVFAGRPGVSSRTSAGNSGPVASPIGEPVSNWLRMNWLPSSNVIGSGERRSSSDRSSKYSNSNAWTSGVYPAASSCSTM